MLRHSIEQLNIQLTFNKTTFKLAGALPVQRAYNLILNTLLKEFECHKMKLNECTISEFETQEQLVWQDRFNNSNA